MPSPVVGENIIDGLEPASPIYNFRYPNMLRLRYEKKRNLPRALLVVGDAYTSADPVSGLGMSLALKEVREMQLLLAKYISFALFCGGAPRRVRIAGRFVRSSA